MSHQRKEETVIQSFLRRNGFRPVGDWDGLWVKKDLRRNGGMVKCQVSELDGLQAIKDAWFRVAGWGLV